MSTTSIPSAAAKEWDDVRSAFASSIMVDTALTSLAQNLDGLEWPFSGKEETASTYLDFTYPELKAEFEDRGQPAAAELLVQILRETMSFDQPFGEMVKQTEAASQRENPMLKTLSRLGIPENFPLSLVEVDESTRELCQLENVQTIGQFALFAQSVSQNVIVGGTFRELLNALAHVDEKVLAQYLPLRYGSNGVHFVEALVQATHAAVPAARLQQVLTWFSADAAQWRQQSAADPTFVQSQLATIIDPAVRQRVLDLVSPHFVTQAPKSGVWSSFSRWFKR